MTLGLVVFIAAVFLMMVLALFFIVCRKYEEGVLGNLVLGLTIIACGLILADAWNRQLMVPEPHVYLLVLCMGAFIARHAYRFAMFHWAGWFGWKRPADMPQMQDAGR